MSAFILGIDHIDLLVTVAMRIPGFNEKYVNIPGTADLLGREMLAENYRSIDYRYDEVNEVPEYSWTPVAEYQVERLTTPQLLQALKAAHCYDYQSCEHKTWVDSKSFWVTQNIETWVEAELTARGLKKQRTYPGDTSMSWPGENADAIQWEWSRAEAAEREEGADRG